MLRALLAVFLVVVAGAASGADLNTSALPRQSYVGKPLRIVLGNAADDHEYRVLSKSANGDWNWNATWSSSHVLEVRPEQAGLLFLGIQSRKSGGAEVELNRYLGQVKILDPTAAMDALSRPLDRLTMLDLDSKVSSMASESQWRTGIDTPRKFADVVRALPTDDARLAVATTSKEGIFALNALQFVSGLWHYGNYDNIRTAGCAALNERQSKPQISLNFDDYLNSPIGCCTDYTIVLGSALEAAGIESRVIATGTHIFNEAYFDGRWWTLDANIGIAYDAPWDVVTDGITQVKAFRFSHAGTQAGSQVYSDAVADFRQVMVLVAASGLMYDFTRTAFDEWKKDVASF
ncbi:transglutaminase-like domain-containing protein [Aureimonas leprariae]|uniref:Transglutaminase domain-containing protein n=1 Tax=Plantimonas leprariae TaxID=2615207 RepID=A0A7V7TUB1_9HYPH|nr:transglutaminase-like domain-containing protein [Aureimonas leprariae]KAB0675914.1 transglutaminase domain-containing protein [Aureimonas leprariae]